MRKLNVGLFTLLGLGSFVAWRNRSQIDQFLHSKGIHLDQIGMDIQDFYRTNAKKISKNLKAKSKSAVQSVRRVV